MNKEQKQKVLEPLEGQHVEIPWIHDLMQGKSAAEIYEAEDNWMRYMNLMKRIMERELSDAVNGIERPVQPQAKVKGEYKLEIKDGKMIFSPAKDF